MKTMIKLLAALMIAVMMLTSAALAAGPIQTEGSVNVRKGAGLSYTSVGTVAAGKLLDCDKTQKDERGVTWYHIVNGKGGWVSSKYASPAAHNIVKATGAVNVRKGAGLEYDRTTAMAKNDTARYLGETKKDSRGVAWYKVNFCGRTGWVSSKYGKLVK